MFARVVREPLFHFAGLAVIIFAWFYTVAGDSVLAERDDVIVINEFKVGQITAAFQAQWGRAPSPDELGALVDKAVEDEILVREALALNLDQGDAVIRNRLIQKMNFFTDSVTQAMQPDEAELQAHMDAKIEQFSVPANLALEQVYLGQHAPEDGGAAALADLKAGVSPKQVGVPSMLPTVMPMSPVPGIDRNFGSGFADAVSGNALNAWSAPVQSAFGWHLVRVTGKEAGRRLELAEVRDKVLFDWQRDKAEEIRLAQIGLLRERYEIRTPEPLAVPGQPVAAETAPAAGNAEGG